MEKKHPKSVVYNLIKFGVLAAFLLLEIFLIIQGLTPGTESSQFSKNVGDQINEFLTNTRNPEAKTIAVENLNIKSVKVKNVNVDYTDEISLLPGDTGIFTCEILPSKATNKSIIYTSSDVGVTVDNFGNFIAVYPCFATIKATSSDNSNIYTQICVRVDEVNATEISTAVSPPAKIFVGQSIHIKVNVLPSNATNKELVWVSSDDAVVEVSQDGYIKAVNEGNATITVSLKEDSTVYKTYDITAELPPPESIPLKEVVIEAPTSTDVYVGESVKLYAQTFPEDAELNQLSWKSSSTSIATVSATESGVTVQFKTAGTVTITATGTYYTDVQDSITFTVYDVLDPNCYVFFESLSAELNVSGGNGAYQATIPYATTARFSYGFSTSGNTADIIITNTDDDVAYFSYGIINAYKQGVTTVTFTASNGITTITATLELTVSENTSFVPATEIVVEDDEIEIDINDEPYLIEYTVLPENASNSVISFSSSDLAVVQVDSYGKLTPIAAGEAIITMSCEDDFYSGASPLPVKELKITVTERTVEATKLAFNYSEITIAEGSSYTLQYYFIPQETTDKSVVFKSMNEKVATVNDKKVTGVKEGVTTIRITSSADPSLYDEITVRVTKLVIHVSSIALSESEIDLIKNDKSEKITIQVYPSNANFKGINVDIDDESVALVTLDSKQTSFTVKALKKGTATITVSSNTYPDIYVELKVIVNEKVSETINLKTTGLTDAGNGEYSVKLNGNAKLAATLDKTATVKTVNFESSNKDVATIGSDGVITLLKEGTTIITVSTTDGELQTTQTSLALHVEPLTFKDTVEDFYFKVRKSIGHFSAFFVLGIFAALAYAMFSAKGFKSKFACFILCLVTGFTIAGITEICQLPIFTTGRYCSFSDVLLDFSGFAVATAIVYFIIFIIYFFIAIRKKHSPDEVLQETNLVERKNGEHKYDRTAADETTTIIERKNPECKNRNSAPANETALVERKLKRNKNQKV